MQELPIKKKISVLIHFLGWGLVGIVLFLLTPLSWKVNLPIQFWMKQAMILGILVSVFYFNMHYLVPRLLFRAKTGIFLLYLIILGILFISLLMLFDNWMNMPELMHRAFQPDRPYVRRNHGMTSEIFILLVFYMSIGISTSMASVQKWQAEESMRLHLDQQRVQAELLYLKAQINPHFFFNTLNNIYSLTNIDVEKAKMAILKLSRMMRYVLYETEKENTLLSKELDFIRDFIELMRLRLSEKVILELEIPEKYEDAGIAPMLLLPFIENCFKHGISSQKSSLIKIEVRLEGKRLYLNTSNIIFNSIEHTPESTASGIGLVNTKRRLELLYPTKHVLQIDDDNLEKEYRVNLEITLS